MKTSPDKIITNSIIIFASVMLMSAEPTNAFIKINWDCHESQSDADCMQTGGLKNIFIYEEIIPDDARQLELIDAKFPSNMPFPKVFITSRGGSVRDAITIGRILRRRHAHIEGRDLFFPDRPAMCNSACVTLAAGAVDRQFDEIGVHRPYISSRDKSCKATRIELTDDDLDEDLQYFEEMGMPPKLFEHLKSTPSVRMTEFFYDPDSRPEDQMIVQLGYRMHPTAPDTPKMFYTNGEPRFTSSIELMEKGVEEGHAEAAYGLGKFYEESAVKDPRDIKSSIHWYEKAGELGSYRAYHNLGVMYGNGHRVKIDHKKAAAYYRKAADLGFAGSQNNLGWAYYKGEGVSKNYGLAIYWITRAIEQGEPFAYSSLGEMRLHAHGFPADDVEAFKWLKLAEEALPRGKARDDNARLLKTVGARMKATDIARAEELANAWRPLKQSQPLMGNICRN